MAAAKLSALKAKGLSEPGRYGDGGGLWLQVRDADHKSWLFRFTRAGKQRQMGLGPFPDVSLGEAREAAQAARAAVRKGLDPIEERRRERATATADRSTLTFRQVADLYLSAHQAAWRNAKHRWQWAQTLSVACAVLGQKRISAIETADVLRVLEPIWREKPETASRLRGRLESILDYGAARGWRVGDNPARWRGHLDKLLPAPGKLAKVTHHPALAWPQIAGFMRELQDQDGVAARALEFTILTAARTSETIGARWSELDLGARVWTVPPERMKAGREHRVPLSDAAMRTIDRMALLRGRAEDWLFPSGQTDGALSNMAMMMLLRRMQRADLTVHGFRSTFRDWCAEATHYPREVAEQALAHTLADKVEAAYRRSDLFEKRRQLMHDWANHCFQERSVLTDRGVSA